MQLLTFTLTGISLGDGIRESKMNVVKLCRLLLPISEASSAFWRDPAGVFPLHPDLDWEHCGACGCVNVGDMKLALEDEKVKLWIGRFQVLPMPTLMVDSSAVFNDSGFLSEGADCDA